MPSPRCALRRARPRTTPPADGGRARRLPVIVPSPPEVDARAYILVDYTSGQVLAAHEADMRLEPASLTKLMTCYVVFHRCAGRHPQARGPGHDQRARLARGGSRTFVQVGSQIPAEVLIKGMIVQSGNDATIALAERIGGTEPAFVQLMNDYAKRLGMTQHALRRQHRPALAHALHHGARSVAAGACAGARLSGILLVVLDPRVRVEQHPAGQPQRPARRATRRSMA